MSILELADYRRRVAALYALVRCSERAELGHQQFMRERDRLFREHPQSALSSEQRQQFRGLEYYPYNPAYRFLVKPDNEVSPKRYTIRLRDDGNVQLRRVARLGISFPSGHATLFLFQIVGYGGGLFLPFRDTTNNKSTYGGGRYLLDTVKHADLGTLGGQLVLDFNFAYNPSCAYNSRWHCPLAPFENRLSVAVEAGEKAFHDFPSH